jgi:hypothetical protein
MFDVQALGLDKINKTLDSMVEQIAELGSTKLAEGNVEWQEVDMKRKFANLTVADKAASTLIWPRSRLSKPQRPKKAKIQRVYAKPIPTQHTGAPARSMRPILRPELFAKLCERMVKVLHETLKWKV